MPDQKFYTDVVYEVGECGEPALKVRPHHDDPADWVQLTTEDKRHWGEIDLILPRELAIRLGRALIKCAEGLGNISN